MLAVFLEIKVVRKRDALHRLSCIVMVQKSCYMYMLHMAWPAVSLKSVWAAAKHAKALSQSELILLFPSESAWTLRTRNPFLYNSVPVGCDPSDRGFPLLPTLFIDLEVLDSQRLSPSSENDFRNSSSSLWEGRKKRVQTPWWSLMCHVSLALWINTSSCILSICLTLSTGQEVHIFHTHTHE